VATGRIPDADSLWFATPLSTDAWKVKGTEYVDTINKAASEQLPMTKILGFHNLFTGLNGQ
jgi:hypothetical protein